MGGYGAQLPPAHAQAAPGCHPSYAGACIPVDATDVDCIGGRGNGPYYIGRVRVVGPDVYELDRDGDGIACDDDPIIPRAVLR
jgi:hypothetical protein